MIVYQVQDFAFSYPFSTRQIKLSGNFVIEAGECILLQGASGAGKSTLLAALKGLIPHLIAGDLTGQINFHNRAIAELNEQDLLKIGYLQQNPDSQLICPDVYSELAFGLENQGYSAELIQTKISLIAERFALTPLLTRKVSSLSGGEKQKINLLAILLLEPEVLLLDEPTAFLDPQSARQIMQIIAEYIQDKTVIIIEHNLHYLQKLVTRGLYIDEDGKIIPQALDEINWLQQIPEQACKYPASATQEVLLELKQLNYAYPDKQLFSNVNLQVRRGEVISLLGENGAGKSTLLKLIAGLIPSRQMIYWHQQDIATLKPIQLWEQISLLWQNPETHFLFNSVAEEVGQQGKILAEFNLSHQALQNPFTLSEGQKRRLSLAIALNQRPQLILLDEPSFGQDYANKLRLIEYINALALTGVSFIMVSHDLNFVNALSQKVYELRAGELVSC